MRKCIECSSRSTYVDKKGWKHWYSKSKDKDENWYCQKCRNKLVTNPKWHAITNAKRKIKKGGHSK